MRILFFIAGPRPSPEEREAARALGTEMFRNAFAQGGTIERCDAVAGLVPAPYAARYPSPETYRARVEAEERAKKDAADAEFQALVERDKRLRAEQAQREADARVRAEADRLRAEDEARALVERERAAPAQHETAASEQPLPPGEIALLDPEDVTGPASAEPIPQPHTEPEAPRSRRAKR